MLAMASSTSFPDRRCPPGEETSRFCHRIERTSPTRGSFEPSSSSSPPPTFACPSTDPWRFLKRLPHKLLRDLGMVISSPPLLIDSLELPMVCSDLLGGGRKSWSESAKWLATIEVDHVKEWFETKRNNRRLGDHFACCVEYILLFSPVARVKNLLTSQQVTHREYFGPSHQASKLKIPNEGKVQSELITEKIGGHVLIKLNAGSPCEEFQRLITKDEELIDEDEKTEFKKDIRIDNKYGKSRVHTIGEFDFLFEEESAVQEMSIYFHSGSSDLRDDCEVDEETRIYHWEVSVKFLLYAGPWEIFGIKTPCCAAWKSSSSEFPLDAAPVQSNFTSKGQIIDGEVRCPMKETLHKNEFLGCFLGPHVGETLYDRKARLMKQVDLAHNEHAASMLWKLFVPSSMGHNRKVEEQSNKKHAGILQVSPRALLKGYLFYEYELWCHLHHTKSAYTEPFANIFNDINKNAKLNVDHWMGWWTRCSGFLDFAHIRSHNGSKWYIVPKLEWLSPVVIEQEDGRFNQLLTIDEFLVVSTKVQEEAERSHSPRKMRFMLAEMVEDNGAWTEASRGFIVEDTWPDSRLYRPHGYNLAWPLLVS